MGARQKLNAAYLKGSLIIAAAVGLAVGSWAAFLLTLAIMVGIGYHGGDIRPAGKGQ